MKFIKGKRYRNNSGRDVDILVEKITHTDDNETAMKVYYIHRITNVKIGLGEHKNDTDNITIQSVNYNDWSEYADVTVASR